MPPWKKVKLGDVAEIIGGGTPKTSVPEYWGGNIPWLSVVDFGGDQKFVHKTEKSISELGLKHSSTRILKKGQIIISARGTVGELAILTKDMAFNQSCYGLTSKHGNTNDFLYYLIKFHINRIKNFTHGSVFDTITRETFDQIEVEIPDLPTQSRIASILSAFDDKIELNHQMNNTLEQMAQALYKKYFVTGIDPDNLPEGWRWEKVKDIFNILIGRTPPRNQHEWFSSDSKDIKWISIKDMGNIGPFIIESSEYLTESAVSKFNIPVIPTNTVILSFKLTVGRVAITTENMLSNEAIAYFISKSDSLLSKEFIYLYLKNFDYNSLGNTSSIATAVNSQTIREMDFLIPDKISIASFNSSVTKLFSKILQNTCETRILEQTRNNLLPKLLNGELPADSVSLEESPETIVA